MIYKYATNGNFTGTLDVSPIKFTYMWDNNSSAGIATNGGFYWVMVKSNNTSSIYKVDPSTGATLATNVKDDFQCGGAVYLNGFFWAVDLSGNIYKINLSGTTVSTYPNPDTSIVGPDFAVGITAKDNYLYIVSHDEIYKVDPADGSTVGSGTIPFLGSINLAVGITYDGTHFWIADADIPAQFGQRIHEFTLIE